MTVIRSCFAITVAVVLLVQQSAQAHSFHVSIAEAEFNAKSKRLEVALRVHPTDLEWALTRMTRQRVTLERVVNIDELIVAYLTKTVQFKLTPAAEKPQKLIWVGKEVSVKEAWLYFEVPLPGGPEGVELKHVLFQELLKDQVNTVVVKSGEKKATVSLTRDDAQKVISFRAPAPAGKGETPSSGARGGASLHGHGHAH